MVNPLYSFNGEQKICGYEFLGANVDIIIHFILIFIYLLVFG